MDYFEPAPGKARRWNVRLAVSVPPLVAVLCLLGSVGNVFALAQEGAREGAQEGHRSHSGRDVSGYIKNLDRASRTEWQKPDEVVGKLQLQAGKAVADLGAGSGYFTFRFAGAVGEQGTVYAVDIEPGMLDHITNRAQEEGIGNLQPVHAAPDDPKLGAGSVDMIFTCNVLHHIENRDRYYPLLLKALRPGGRFAVVDFYKRELPVGPGPEMKITKQDMIREVEAAGFHLAEDFDFLPYQYFLVFELK